MRRRKSDGIELPFGADLCARPSRGNPFRNRCGLRVCYDADYLADPSAQAVSLTLPKQSEAYISKTLFAFFDGLIPEGWLLNIVTQNWKLDAKDRFGLLLVACQDCIGAVSVREVVA